MMEKMGRSGDRIETGIQVEEYETLELKIEFSKLFIEKSMEMQKRYFQKLKKN